MRPIPPDPLNPDDIPFDADDIEPIADINDADNIDDADLPGEVPAPDTDDEVSLPPGAPGEQYSDESPDDLDPEGNPSPFLRPL